MYIHLLCYGIASTEHWKVQSKIQWNSEHAIQVPNLIAFSIHKMKAFIGFFEVLVEEFFFEGNSFTNVEIKEVGPG